MIIAPLVFSTLGLGRMSVVATVGRVGGKALAWFVFASLVSLTLGFLLVNFLEPGQVLDLPLPEANASSGIQASALTLTDFIEHTVPSSVIDVMARNEILQIVVFAIFFGTAMAAIGERGRTVVDVLDALAHIMLKVTSYVMLFAPLAVFGALASTVASRGLGILGVYGLFIAEFYLGLVILWLLLLGVDHFLDMGRSATNVVGNSVATVLVSPWERELRGDEGRAH